MPFFNEMILGIRASACVPILVLIKKFFTLLFTLLFTAFIILIDLSDKRSSRIAKWVLLSHTRKET